VKPPNQTKRLLRTPTQIVEKDRREDGLFIYEETHTPLITKLAKICML
jgi:hypothetical protein